MMKNWELYNIFYTAFGWASFGLDQGGMRFLILPDEDKEFIYNKTKNYARLFNCYRINKESESLIDMIKDYFEGKRVGFSGFPLNLKQFTKFQREIYQTVSKIPYGNVLSYKKVAEISGYPKAFRAVGTTMKKNLIPLIIPCHRVIKSDGCLGGFSSKGGIELKRRMLKMESGFCHIKVLN